MANLNSVVISGNLTRDPELRSTPSGTSVCKMRVAVNERRKQGEQWVDAPNYFDVTVWGAQGENCAQYLQKGAAVGVQGRLQWREWEANDGSGKRQAVDIVADRVQWPPKGSNGNSAGGGGNSFESDVPADTDGLGPASTAGVPVADDIPF